MKSKIPHDPFHDPAPQVSNVYKYEPPPELAPIDSDKSRAKNVKPIELTDEGFRPDFVPTEEPKHNFSKHLERKK